MNLGGIFGAIQEISKVFRTIWESFLEFWSNFERILWILEQFGRVSGKLEFFGAILKIFRGFGTIWKSFGEFWSD